MYKNREQPATREEALAEGQEVYLRPKEMGRRCQHDGCEHLYTETQECVACTCKALWDETKQNRDQYPLSVESALTLGLDYTINGRPCLKGPHLLATPLTGGTKCATCIAIRANSPRQKAHKAGHMKYMPDAPCDKCGTTSLKRIDNGACDGCTVVFREARRKLAPQSARIKARLANEMWYTPDEPCPDCHTKALKRVNNGQCQGCNPPKRAKGISDNTRAVMDAMPADYIVDKDTARTMGLTAYRDGKFCPEGHTGWKYMVGGCVTCGGED